MGKEVKAKAEKNAEERILDVLVSKSSHLQLGIISEASLDLVN